MERRYRESDIETLKNYLPQYVESITQRDKKAGKDMYICPLCGSGTHKSKTGAFRLYRDSNTWFCFSCQSKNGENRGGSIFDLIKQYEGITEFPEQVKRAAEIAGISIEPEKILDVKGRNYDHRGPQNVETDKSTRTEEKPLKTPLNASQRHTKEEPATDNGYIDYYRQCYAEREGAAGYLKQRGISTETAGKYKIGYDRKTQRVIVPVSKSFYLARAAAGQEPRYKNPAGQTPEIFNKAALWDNSGAVFVTEGVFTAISVVEAGGQAIAINSVSNAGQLVSAVKERPAKGVILVSLDNDDVGRKASAELCKDLQAIKADCEAVNIAGAYKDANDRLTADRDGLQRDIAAAIRDATKPDNFLSYLQADFTSDKNRYKEGYKKTGFEKWDEVTNGLHSGVYMLAGAPGTGKTTLAWQICENLAAQGEDCVYFTLEQSMLDLAVKSIMRRKKIANMDTTATIQAIKEGAVNADRELTQIEREDGDRISIVTGNFSLSARDICGRVERQIERTGRAPVVIVDYLQALKPMEEGRKRTGNREAIEDTVDALCSLKNRYNLTMIIVSSVSRANYRAALDIDALKESGRLEYSADAVYTLEYTCVYESAAELFESDGDIAQKKKVLAAAQAGKGGIREMSLKCVKSRYCNAGERVEFKYYPGADLYIEKGGDYEPVSQNEVPFSDPGNIFRRNF